MRKIRVFSLPAEEEELNVIINDESNVVLEKVITPCPKEGIILYLIEYEKQY